MTQCSAHPRDPPPPIRLIEPFGAEVTLDLRRPLDHETWTVLRTLLRRHKLLLFRNQVLDEAAQVQALSMFGPVLSGEGDMRQISSTGNFGDRELAFHSDQSFTNEPCTYLSLYALEVNPAQSWTSFANSIAALAALPAHLRERLGTLEACDQLSMVQTHREISHGIVDFLPHRWHPAVLHHPATGEDILYVNEMQTIRLAGLSSEDSEALLQELFATLYTASNVYEHRWFNGDLVIWDNLALQHARPDLHDMFPRVLQRVVVAERSFYELCPEFDINDPKVRALAGSDGFARLRARASA